MADSPLSITASVTGILTFVAAILAFIYVRYNVIRNGHDEMMNIYTSVIGFMAETSTILNVAATGDHPRSHLLEDLFIKVLKTEIGVMKKCMVVFGVDDAQIPSDSYLYSTYAEILPQYQSVLGLYQLGLDAMSRSSTAPGIIIPSLNLFASLDIFIQHDYSRRATQVRWYRVRDSVLEMIHRRETLRSQLLFHQISLMNLQAKSHEALTHKLLDEKDQLRSLVEEVIKVNTELRGIILKMTPLDQPDLQLEATHKTIAEN